MKTNEDAPILKVLRGERGSRPPIWFMRQAGRILPEYRALKERKTFEELLRDPELGFEVTMMPLRRLEVDAAILFTDLLVPLEAMGNPVTYKPGPVLRWTFEGEADLPRLRERSLPEAVEVPLETARRVRAALPPEKTLLGFLGAPWTLGAYLVEGEGSKNWSKYRAFAYREPGTFASLMEGLADVVLDFGLAQARAGCDALQLFDSWAGVADPTFFRERVGPSLRRIVEGLHEAGIPVIYYVNGAAGHLRTMVETGADCLGIDWRIDMADACRRLPEGLPVQGNLDPAALFADPEATAGAASRVLRGAAGRPHIFNLGHGFDPATPIAHVEALVRFLRTVEPGEGDPS